MDNRSAADGRESKTVRKTVARRGRRSLVERRRMYAAAALTGLLAAQRRQPDPVWICEWAHELGRRMVIGERRPVKRAATKAR